MESFSDKKTVTTRRMRTVAMILIALMTVAVIVLSVFLGLTLSDKNGYMSDMENIYQKSYYELMESISSIENNLTKFGVMKSASLQRKTLEEIVVNSEVAVSAVNTMSTGNNNLRTLQKYLNQVLDYSRYLERQINAGEKVSEDEYKNISKLAEIAKNVNGRLYAMQAEMGENFSFVESLGGDADIFNDIVTDLNGNVVDYPTLIYDGPFSDGVKDREPKGIHGEELSENEIVSKAAKYLVGYNISDVKVYAESENRIPSYIVETKLVGGERSAYLQISKKGGHLLSMQIYRENENPTLTVEECAELAEQYCKSIGMEGMKAVWSSNNNSTVYINLCYSENDIIYYPDMVKLKVSLDTGEIIGYEGLNYAFNHTDRELDEPSFGKEDAVVLVHSDMTDITCRLALIPLSVEKETLTYEVSGKIGDERYFIYIDAETGEEVQILRVIDSNQGELLM